MRLQPASETDYSGLGVSTGELRRVKRVSAPASRCGFQREGVQKGTHQALLFDAVQHLGRCMVPQDAEQGCKTGVSAERKETKSGREFAAFSSVD